MSDCKNCGVELLADSAYCGDCGEPVNENLKKTKPKRMSTVLIVVITVISVSVLMIGVIATIAVPQLLEARRHSYARSTVGKLRAFATDQETFKADNTLYGTIEKIALDGKGKIDLRNETMGFVFVDIIKEPSADCYAVLASPKNWDNSRKSHYIITSSGTVRECKEKELPFKLSLPATPESIDILDKFKEVR